LGASSPVFTALDSQALTLIATFVTIIPVSDDDVVSCHDKKSLKQKSRRFWPPAALAEEGSLALKSEMLESYDRAFVTRADIRTFILLPCIIAVSESGHVKNSVELVMCLR
jgi:hypothetical protein